MKRFAALLLALVMLFGLLAFTACTVPTPSDEAQGPTPPAVDPGSGSGDGGSGNGGTGGGSGSGGSGSGGSGNTGPDYWLGMVPLEGFEELLNETVAAALLQVNECIVSYEDGFPNAYSTNLAYKPSQKNSAGWVQGFWPGVLWQAYELSGNINYALEAYSYVDSFYDRIEGKLGVDNHDMGFLYTPSCVPAYELLGDGKAKEAALMAADQLMTRFHEDAGFIQAWGTIGDESEYRLIVDCMMNLPLLYWASEVTGDSKYATAANRHAAATIGCAIREDGSTYHTYYFDPETKQPAYGKTKQGYSDDSAWSRGQSWMVYGTALAYGYSDNPELLAAFKKVTNYFIDHLSDDYIPCWDFTCIGMEGAPKETDTSAAAIAICGILEGCKYLDRNDPDRARYLDAAQRMMVALIEGYFTGSETVSAEHPDADGLLIGVTQSRLGNNGLGAGVEEMTPYGDYFFIEALRRFVAYSEGEEWDSYW